MEFRVCDAIVVHQIPKGSRNIMEKIQFLKANIDASMRREKEISTTRLDAVFLPKPADDSFFSLESRKTP